MEIKRNTLFSAALLTTLCFIGPVRAEDPDHVKRLLETNECSGCDLSFANLRDKDLRGADLSYADLARADLTDANLNGADLEGANLNGAIMNGAIMPNGEIHK